MSYHTFIKFDGIPGESRDAKHKDWIEVLSHSFSVSQPATISSSSHGSKSAERANFSDFHFTKALDKASPLLFSACATGQHFPKVVFEACRAGGDDSPVYFKVELEDVMLTSYNNSGPGALEAIANEDIALSYGKIIVTYIPTDQTTGRAMGNISRGYDIRQNKKI